MTHSAESRHGQSLARVGVKAGGYDDALHLTARRRERYTLCGMTAETRNTEVLTGDVEVPVHSVCWTCVMLAKDVLRERANAA